MTLAEEVEECHLRAVKMFAALRVELDYSVESIKELESFFAHETENGQPIPDGLLAENVEQKLFNFGCYLGEVIRRAVRNGKWLIDESGDSTRGQVAVSNGFTAAFPVDKVIKRLRNGPEDNLYHYAVTTIKVMDEGIPTNIERNGVIK